jgi:enediyne polyketide synthase
VELVVDVELSVNNDPYLNDHVFQGERVFPAVLGLEAMAQVAMALLETTELPIFEDVQFNRPVVVSESAPLKIRLAALVRGANQIQVVLRSEQTAFQVDHFRAILPELG